MFLQGFQKYQQIQLANLNRFSFKQSISQVFVSTCTQTRRGNRRNVVSQALFGFGKDKKKDQNLIPGYYKREDYTNMDVEQYFNYMGMLASEGSYDNLNKMLNSGLDPIDMILIWACREDDVPKVEEALNAGANPNVKDLNGKSAMDLTDREEVLDMLKGKGAIKV